MNDAFEGGEFMINDNILLYIQQSSLSDPFKIVVFLKKLKGPLHGLLNNSNNRMVRREKGNLHRQFPDYFQSKRKNQKKSWIRHPELISRLS